MTQYMYSYYTNSTKTNVISVSKSVSKIHDQQIMHVPLTVVILLSTWNVFDELAIDVFIYEFTWKRNYSLKST